MSGKLRLGPLPKVEMVRLTVTLPAQVKADLDRYAELYAVTYGEPVDPAALVPHMLATFMERDRAFKRAGHPLPLAAASSRPSAVISATMASTSDTADDASDLSSR